jgi:aspartate racemase
VRKIGIVGGVTWATTVAYYSGLCRLAEEAHAASGTGGAPLMPEIGIESLDHRRAVAALGRDPDEGSWTEFDAYHAGALRRLEASGADFALIASNTPHHRFASIVRGTRIPVINLFEELALAASRAGARDVLIMGTGITMGSAPLVDAFRRRSVAAAAPGADARRETVELIDSIHEGNSAGALERLRSILAPELAAWPGQPPAVCLACTEFPLLFGNGGIPVFRDLGITYIDSARVHIEAAFARATKRAGP